MADAENGPGAQADRIAGLDTSMAHPARVYAPEGVVSAHGAVARKPGA